jgi:hypothetical protein
MARLYPTVTHRLGSAVTAISRQLARTHAQIRLVLGSSSTFSAKVPVFPRLVIGLISSLAVFCIMAIVYGRVGSIPDPITRIGLGRCGIVACFRGAIPGWTDWSKVKVDLGLVKHNQMFEHQIFVPLGSDGGAALYPSMDGRTVGLIYIAVPSDISLMVGDIVNQFGPPCVLTVPIRPDYLTLTLYYPRLIITTKISKNYLAIYTPVAYIALNDSTELLNMPIDSCQAFILEHSLPPRITHPWHGFVSIRHYLGEG